MKKAIILIISIIMVMALCACSESKKTASTSSAETVKTKELKGIDVSAYNGEIDWKKVANDGIEFAMIRLGGRGYGEEGELFTDDYALTNIKQAKENKIKVGAYFYSQATSEAEAEEEADYAVQILNKTKLDLPVAYDFEHVGEEEARTDNITSEERNNFSEVFCGKINEAGYDAMVYAFAEDFDNGVKTNYPLWLSDKENKSKEKYIMLQYSTDGKVNGINGSVDLDKYIEEVNE